MVEWDSGRVGSPLSRGEEPNSATEAIAETHSIVESRLNNPIEEPWSQVLVAIDGSG